MNLTKSLTIDYTTMNLKTKPSGPVILLTRIKSGTLLVPSNMQPTPSNDFITVIPKNQDGITTIETENNRSLPTQEEVRKEEVEWKASIKKARRKKRATEPCLTQAASTTSALCT